MPNRSLHPGVPFPTLGSSGVYFRKEVLSVRCILESSSRCPNIRTIAPPNNLVLHVPCRPPIIPVCGRTYHAVCLKSRWPSLGAYLVKTAGTHDSAEAPALCEGINEGEIVIFDKAYVDFKHLWRLSQRGVFWITRAKDNMKYDVVGQHSAPKLNILRDVVIKLTGQRTSVWYPETLRLIEAIVEIDGKPKRMTFITDNFSWAASSICNLYKARWAIEVFFKEIKQTLQLSDFIGYNENAVRWQIWTALLTYILLRFIAWQNEWKHTFTRLFTALRGVIWRCLDMGSVLRCCGTASDSVRMRGAPEQAYLPGFAQL